MKFNLSLSILMLFTHLNVMDKFNSEIYPIKEKSPTSLNRNMNLI